jgi:hypothetical protein
MNRNSVRQKSERCPTEIGIGVRQPPEYAVAGQFEIIIPMGEQTAQTQIL